MRRLPLALIVSAVGLVAVACSDGSVPTRPDPSALRGPSFAKPPAGPAADGVISSGEYSAGATLSFNASLPSGGTTPVTVYITHDRTYLYLAMVFDRGSAFHSNDIVSFEFDNDNDGVRENGDDIVLTAPLPTLNVAFPGADLYRFDNGDANQVDDADGGTTDVISAYGLSGTTATFEMRHDLNSADNAHDFSIDPMRAAQTVGFIAGMSLEADPPGSNTFTHSFKPSALTYCQLTIGKKTTSVTCP